MSERSRLLSRRSFSLVMAAGVTHALVGTLAGCASDTPEQLEDAEETVTDQATTESIPEVSPISQGLVCVSEFMGNTIALIDIEAQEIIKRIPVGNNPTTMMHANEKLYICNSGSGELAVVPLSDSNLAKRIPVGYQPTNLCFDEAGQRLFVADFYNNGIHIVDTVLDSKIQTITLGRYGYRNRTDPPVCCIMEGLDATGRRTVALALSPDNSILYCANYGTCDIARVDLLTDSELDPFDGVVAPQTMILTVDGSHLLLAGVGGNVEEKVSCLYVIERDTGKRVEEVPVGVAVADVSQTKDGETVLALAKDDGMLVLYDRTTWAEVGRVALQAGVDAVTLSSDDASVYVSNSSSGVLSIINRATLEITGSVHGLLNPKDILAL